MASPAPSRASNVHTQFPGAVLFHQQPQDLLRFWFWWFASCSVLPDGLCRPPGGVAWLGAQPSRAPSPLSGQVLPLVSCLLITFFPSGGARAPPALASATSSSSRDVHTNTDYLQKRCAGGSLRPAAFTALAVGWFCCGVWILSDQDRGPQRSGVQSDRPLLCPLLRLWGSVSTLSRRPGTRASTPVVGRTGGQAARPPLCGRPGLGCPGEGR